MNSIQRLNYFTSQFLVEEDFTDEQTYHREMRHRHNQSLHTPGVVNGLMVSKAGNKQVKVSPGIAIDREGQEIVLFSESAAITLDNANTDVFVMIEYGETQKEKAQDNGSDSQFRRIQEDPKITFSTSRPSEGSSLILLASVTLDKKGNIVGVPDNQVRTVAGAANALDFSAANSITLTPDKDNNHLLVIGENHSVRSDNPHGVTVQQIGALSTSGGKVTGELIVEGNIVANSVVAKPNAEIKNTSQGSTFKFTKVGEFEAIPNLAANIVTRGNPVMITANFSYSSGGKVGNQCMFTIQRSTDSQPPINLAGPNSCVQHVLMTGESGVPIAIVWIDTPPKGTHKYMIAGRVLSPQIPIVGPTDAPTTAQIAVIELN
jgi:hypothetical protein